MRRFISYRKGAMQMPPVLSAFGATYYGIIAMTCLRSVVFSILFVCTCIMASPCSRAFALTPKEVARIVSNDVVNQRFIDSINIDENYDKLEIPILEGSSVLPALTIVAFPVHDEHIDHLPWEPSSPKELERLTALRVGPWGQQTDSEVSCRMNDVRTVLWPSGDVLWMADTGRLSSPLRNRKGRVVEYRFARIDFGRAIRHIEEYISNVGRPRGYYRQSVLHEHSQLYKYARCHDLVIVNQDYIFKCVTQVADRRPDLYYLEWQFNTMRAKEDVNRFIGICEVVRGALPKKGFSTLSSEPVYAWKGKTDLYEASQGGDGACSE